MSTTLKGAAGEPRLQSGVGHPFQECRPWQRFLYCVPAAPLSPRRNPVGYAGFRQPPATQVGGKASITRVIDLAIFSSEELFLVSALVTDPRHTNRLFPPSMMSIIMVPSW